MNGFWIFMQVMNLLLPLAMLGIGIFFMKKSGPKKINVLFGYRTSMSMKNKETWNFAHIYFGKQWLILGLLLLPISVAAMLFVLNKNDEIIGITGGILFGIQCILLTFPIITTEISLRKHFDKNGNRLK